ncbi:MAG: MFS transporter, partial [Thermomicrobiales bacterium]
GLVIGLIEAAARGWGDLLVLAALVVGVAALVTFVVVEARGRAPMMPLGLFRSRTFSGANLLTLLLYAALGGALYFVPFNLIQVRGYSATAAGAALLPMILILFGLSRWAGGLVPRFGAKLPLVIGPLIAGAGFALFAVPGTGGSYWTTFFPAAVVLGFGMTITVAPLTTTVMGAVAERHAGLASGINNAVSRAGGLLAIAVFGILVAGAFDRTLDVRLDVLGLQPEQRRTVEDQRDRLAAAEPPAELDATAAAGVERAIDEAFVSGFRVVMLVAAALAVASAVAAWRTIVDTDVEAADDLTVEEST